MSRLSVPKKQDWKASVAGYGVHRDSPKELDGYIETPFGFVMVSVYDDACNPVTILRFIHHGRMHHWSWERAYSARYLPTLATRMAASIVRSR